MDVLEKRNVQYCTEKSVFLHLVYLLIFHNSDRSLHLTFLHFSLAVSFTLCISPPIAKFQVCAFFLSKTGLSPDLRGSGSTRAINRYVLSHISRIACNLTELDISILYYLFWDMALILEPMLSSCMNVSDVKKDLYLVDCCLNERQVTWRASDLRFGFSIHRWFIIFCNIFVSL